MIGTGNVEASDPNIDSGISQDADDNIPVPSEDDGTESNTDVAEKRRMVNVTDKEIETTLQYLMHIPEYLEEDIP